MNFLKPKAIHFAPMEGITDPSYRRAIMQLYPEWDSYSTDFLRIPTVGGLKSEKLRSHYGESIFADSLLKEKTIFQILTTLRAQTAQALPLINHLQIKHLDLNLGCPSRKVNSHGGGSFLLSDIESLSKLIRGIREAHKGFFSVKMRVGYRDDKLYDSLLKMLENEGVEAITVHARTRDQLYKGIADWSYIQRACKLIKTPIIGNGDVWSLEDIHSMFDQTNCHGIMIARGALKTPWMANLYKNNKIYSKEELLEIRKINLPLYFEEIGLNYKRKNLDDLLLLKRFKAFSRYLFDDFINPIELKSKFLRAKSLNEFKDHLHNLPDR